MRDLTAQIESELARADRLAAGARMLIAVSGGRDSMVLLHLVARLAPAHQWHPVVAHFHHGLRVAADADQHLVEAGARRLDLPFVTGRADARVHADARRLSLEHGARELRYAFLGRAARAAGAGAVLAAHHADDQAELFLVRLLRGAGGLGLGGMDPVAPLPGSPEIRLLRPLLAVTRADLAAWAAANGVPFREDESNSDRRALRNRIRLDLLPALEGDYQPGLRRVLLRTAGILHDEAAACDAIAAAWLDGADTRSFEALPTAVQRHALRRQVLSAGFEPDFELIEGLRRRPDVPVPVAPGAVLVRDAAGRLKRLGPPLPFRPDALALTLNGPAGTANFGGVAFHWRRLDVPPSLPPAPDPHTPPHYLDAVRVGARIRLRHWRAGDRFHPAGLGVPARLQDLFTNRRIPRDRRRTLVVAEAGDGRLFWVEGLRVSEDFRARPESSGALVWDWMSRPVPAVGRT